jgi:hypothetical protein
MNVGLQVANKLGDGNGDRKIVLFSFDVTPEVNFVYFHGLRWCLITLGS